MLPIARCLDRDQPTAAIDDVVFGNNLHEREFDEAELGQLFELFDSTDLHQEKLEALSGLLESADDLVFVSALVSCFASIGEDWRFAFLSRVLNTPRCKALLAPLIQKAGSLPHRPLLLHTLGHIRDFAGQQAANGAANRLTARFIAQQQSAEEIIALLDGNS
ncbi:MAG: hypothetical protein AB7K09_13715 [Planctomycetota bacterium]